MSEPTLTEFHHATNELLEGLYDLLNYATCRMEHARDLLDRGLYEEASEVLASQITGLTSLRFIQDARQPRS